MTVRCPKCRGTAREAIPLPDQAGVLLTSCRACFGQGLVSCQDPGPTAGLRGPAITLAVGLALTGLGIALAPAWRDRPGFQWLGIPLVLGLVLAIVGFRLTLPVVLLRYGQVKVPTWVGVLVLLAPLGVLALVVLLNR